MLVFAFGGADRIPGDFVDLRLDRRAVERLHADARRRDRRHLAAFEEDHPPGLFEDRRDVRGDELLALAQADGDAARVADAHRHQSIRLALAHDDDGVRALQTADRPPRRLGHVAVRAVVGEARDQLHDHFGVGVGLELDAFRRQFLAQFQVVFDNAVVDDDEIAVHADVGMGVVFGGRAVRRPARMPDADLPADRVAFQSGAQIGELAHVAPQGDPAVLRRRRSPPSRSRDTPAAPIRR